MTKNEEKSCAKATYYLKIRFRVGILNPSLFQITTPSPPIKIKQYFTSTIILNEKRNILKRRENNHINQHFFIYFFGQGGVILYFI